MKPFSDEDEAIVLGVLSVLLISLIAIGLLAAITMIAK